MAIEAGIHTAKLLHIYGYNKKALCHSELKELQEIERFAELVRADEREQGQKWFDAVTAQHKQLILAEREACAKVCEPQEEHDDPLTAWKIAAAIRARGNT
jgi:glycine/D-amino acid oxidase-like deaminating enzyme